MNWRLRLLGFLLMCSVLIGLNVIATLNGAYAPLPGKDVAAEALFFGESAMAADY
jgi:hypothetical protein